MRTGRPVGYTGSPTTGQTIAEHGPATRGQGQALSVTGSAAGLAGRVSGQSRLVGGRVGRISDWASGVEGQSLGRIREIVHAADPNGTLRHLQHLSMKSTAYPCDLSLPTVAPAPRPRRRPNPPDPGRTGQTSGQASGIKGQAARGFE